jgi:hypothetical protein
MANKTLFASLRHALIPQTDTVNSEKAPAYALAPKQALAQYAATGCFGRTFYATADKQLTLLRRGSRRRVATEPCSSPHSDHCALRSGFASAVPQHANLRRWLHLPQFQSSRATGGGDSVVFTCARRCLIGAARSALIRRLPIEQLLNAHWKANRFQRYNRTQHRGERA